MLKLYSHPLSTYARRVAIALIEKAIPCETVMVDMRSGEHRRPEYLAINPYARVPAIVDGDFVLYESAAILRYIEATHPQPALVPEDPRGRALVDMHMTLCDVQFTRHAGGILFPKRFLPRERWDEQAMAHAKEEIEKHFVILERQLGDHEYLVGDRYTLADVCYTPFLEFLRLFEAKVSPGIAAWAERLLTRPSAVATRPSM